MRQIFFITAYDIERCREDIEWKKRLVVKYGINGISAFVVAYFDVLIVNVTFKKEFGGLLEQTRFIV